MIEVVFPASFPAGQVGGLEKGFTSEKKIKIKHYCTDKKKENVQPVG